MKAKDSVGTQAPPLCGSFLGAPFSHSACIYSLINSFNKIIKQSFTIHLLIYQHSFSKSLCLEESSSWWHQNSLFNKVIHLFSSLPSFYLQIQNPRGTLTSGRTAENTPEQLVEAHSSRGSHCPQNQRCPSSTLEIAGVSPPPPPLSPAQPLRNKVSGSLGFQQYLSHVFK